MLSEVAGMAVDSEAQVGLERALVFLHQHHVEIGPVCHIIFPQHPLHLGLCLKQQEIPRVMHES